VRDPNEPVLPSTDERGYEVQAFSRPSLRQARLTTQRNVRLTAKDRALAETAIRAANAAEQNLARDVAHSMPTPTPMIYEPPKAARGVDVRYKRDRLARIREDLERWKLEDASYDGRQTFANQTYANQTQLVPYEDQSDWYNPYKLIDKVVGGRPMSLAERRDAARVAPGGPAASGAGFAEDEGEYGLWSPETQKKLNFIERRTGIPMPAYASEVPRYLTHALLTGGTSLGISAAIAAAITKVLRFLYKNQALYTGKRSTPVSDAELERLFSSMSLGDGFAGRLKAKGKAKGKAVKAKGKAGKVKAKGKAKKGRKTVRGGAMMDDVGDAVGAATGRVVGAFAKHVGYGVAKALMTFFRHPIKISAAYGVWSALDPAVKYIVGRDIVQSGMDFTYNNAGKAVRGAASQLPSTEEVVAWAAEFPKAFLGFTLTALGALPFLKGRRHYNNRAGRAAEYAPDDLGQLFGSMMIDVNKGALVTRGAKIATGGVAAAGALAAGVAGAVRARTEALEEPETSPAEMYDEGPAEPPRYHSEEVLARRAKMADAERELAEAGDGFRSIARKAGAGVFAAAAAIAAGVAANKMRGPSAPDPFDGSTNWSTVGGDDELVYQRGQGFKEAGRKIGKVALATASAIAAGYAAHAVSSRNQNITDDWEMVPSHYGSRQMAPEAIDNPHEFVSVKPRISIERPFRGDGFWGSVKKHAKTAGKVLGVAAAAGLAINAGAHAGSRVSGSYAKPGPYDPYGMNAYDLRRKMQGGQ